MGNEMLEYQQTAAEVKAGVQLIQQVMKEIMKKGVHFGIVPGCGDKPTLLKPGSEKILTTFRIAVDPRIEDLSGPDVFRYRVTARGLHIPTERFVGAGVGEASSDEEKYKWREAKTDAEFDTTPEDRRRIKYLKGWGNKPDKEIQQVRTNPADVANTVLKMAKKRAQIDMTLTATAASDIFAQDLEDTPAAADGAEKTVADPERKSDKKDAAAPAEKKAETKTSDLGSRKRPKDSKTIIITVKDVVSLAKGEGSRGPWELWGLVSDKGEKFATFEIEIVDLAHQVHSNGQYLKLAYKAGKKGNDIIDAKPSAEPF